MATGSDLRARLVLEAQAEGQGEIEALARELEKLAAEGGDAAPKLEALAGSLREMAEQDRLVAEFAELSRQAAGSAGALEAARKALDATGVGTKGLTDQQITLRAQLLQAQRQVADYSSVIGQMHGEVKGLAPAMQGLFKELGLRGVKQITAEIERLQAAMRSLKGQRLLPEDAARASAELQRRIEGLRAEMKGAQDSAKGAAQAVGHLGQSSQSAGDQIGAAARKAAGWAAALVGLNEIKQLATNVVQTGSAFEQLQRRLTGIVGGSEKAAAAMDMIKQLAKDTPYDVQGLAESFAKLSAFGLQPSREQMLAIIDTASKLGGGTEMLSGVTLALGQAWTKSKLQGEEILQLAERGVPVWDLLAKATGKNVAELQKMSEAGQLGRDVILKLIDAMGQKNAGASADLMASYAGAVQRAQDAMQEFLNMIAQSGVLQYLTEQLKGLLVQFDRMKDSGELQAWADRIGKGFVSIMTTAQGLIGVLQQLAPVIELAAKSFAMFKLAEFAGGLTGIIDKGSTATSVLRQMGSASLVAKIGMAAAASAAVALGYEILSIAKTYGEYRQQLARISAAEASLAEATKAAAGRYAEISQRTGVLVTNMRELDAAVESGALVFDQASAKYMSAAQAQAALAGAARATAAELAAVDASRMVAAFDAANTSAAETGKAITALADLLQNKTPQGAAAFALAMTTIEQSGKLSAAQVAQAWQEALGKLSTGGIGALKANLEEAARTGVITATQLAQANDQILAASFERLGINAAQALGKVSGGAQQAIDAVRLIADETAAAGLSAQQSARTIELALTAAVPKADSLEGLKALQAELKGLADSGRLGAEGVARVQQALDRQRAVIEQQLPGIQSLGEALRQLGVKPQAELREMAQQAKAAFEAVRGSGTATTRELSEAWRAMAEAQIAANDGVADAMLQAQAAQYGMVIEADNAGKAVVKSMAEAARATNDVGDAARRAGKHMGDAAEGAKKAGKDAAAAIEPITFSWLSAATAASKYRDEAAAHANAIEGQWQSIQGKMITGWSGYWDAWNNHFNLLKKLAEEYAQAMDAIDERQQALERRHTGAASGVDALRLRLLELNGTEEEIAQARAERERKEIEYQMEMAKLEAERASMRGDTAAAERQRQDIEMLQQQLSLLDQIHKTERQQREDKRRAERQGGGSGGGSGGDGGGAGGKSGRGAGGSGMGTGAGGGGAGAGAGGGTYNVTLNANGVNDPVKLARMIAPELQKLSRLAR